MKADAAKFLYGWYYSPGEVVRGYGFYVNPYNQWHNTKFQHIFAFDPSYNLYVGQYSVYQTHVKEMFDLEDKREYGMLWPEKTPIIQFEFMENKNIHYLNKRLRPMCQRFLDYGLPGNSRIVCNSIDLWHLTLDMVLKDKKLNKVPAERLRKLFT